MFTKLNVCDIMDINKNGGNSKWHTKFQTNAFLAAHVRKIVPYLQSRKARTTMLSIPTLAFLAVLALALAL